MHKAIKIILAEDEPSLGQIVQESLETKGFDVILCKNGEEALQAYVREKPQLLVLDVMMPKKDGFTLAQEIRKMDLHIPIIFLTAKSQTADVVEGFHVGGNDYLKKPFSMEELIVRILNLLDQKARKEAKTIQIGEFVLRLKEQLLCYKDETPVGLTHREAYLLYHLYSNQNSVLERSYILKKLWGNDDFFNARSMDVFITKLRNKLKKDSNIQILNVRGYGYKLVC